MLLDQIAAGSRVFIDSTIFIYHFTGASADCKQFLERCEGGDLKGVTSVVVLAEVAHRLMMVEAVSRGSLTTGNVVRKLRAKPELVARLETYREQVGANSVNGSGHSPIRHEDFAPLPRRSEGVRSPGQ